MTIKSLETDELWGSRHQRYIEENSKLEGVQILPNYTIIFNPNSQGNVRHLVHDFRGYVSAGVTDGVVGMMKPHISAPFVRDFEQAAKECPFIFSLFVQRTTKEGPIKII